MKLSPKKISEIIQKSINEIENFQKELFQLNLPIPHVSYVSEAKFSETKYQVSLMRYNAIEDRILIFSPNIIKLLTNKEEGYLANKIRITFAHEDGHRYHFKSNPNLLQYEIEIESKRQIQQEMPSFQDLEKSIYHDIFCEGVAYFAQLQYSKKIGALDIFEEIEQNLSYTISEIAAAKIEEGLKERITTKEDFLAGMRIFITEGGYTIARALDRLDDLNFFREFLTFSPQKAVYSLIPEVIPAIQQLSKAFHRKIAPAGI